MPTDFGVSPLAPPAPATLALLRRAYLLMHTAAEMAALFEEQKTVASRYVHATARGHEAVQLAAAFLLTGADYAAPYYRDDAMLLGMGLREFSMHPAQLLAVKQEILNTDLGVVTTRTRRILRAMEPGEIASAVEQLQTL